MRDRARVRAALPVPNPHHDSAEAGAVLAAATHLIGTSDPLLSAFFSSFTRYAITEDIVRFTGAELAGLVGHVYRTSATRTPGRCLVETFDLADATDTARPEAILVAVNDDMPFLYDSCIAEVSARGFNIRAAFHPIMARKHDGLAEPVTESVIVLALGAADKEQLEALRSGLRKIFENVYAAVRDWTAMVARLRDTTVELKNNPPDVPETQLSESLAFLEWLADNHFTFLGARDYLFDGSGNGKLDPDFSTGLGLLADPERRVVRRGTDRSNLTPEVRDFLTKPNPLIIAKSNERSPVHRRVYMDYIGIKRFDQTGTLKGERRFVGLFTSTAYSQFPPTIPLLRQKVARALAGSGLPIESHDGKALAHILNTYPRDELFQISEEELLDTALGILALVQRPKVRVFLRFDRFDRYVSALVFVPRERYNTTVREKVHAILARSFDGRTSSATPSLEQDALARVHFIIGRNPGPRPHVDARELEAEIRAVIRTWDDEFTDTLAARHGEAAGDILETRYTGAFPPAYRDTFTPADAIGDIALVERVLSGQTPGGNLLVHVYERNEPDDEDHYLRLKVLARDDYVSLSDSVPVFENLGLKVIAEDTFLLTPKDKTGEERRVAVLDFLMEPAEGGTVDLARVKTHLEDAFHAIWRGEAESDGFNRLILLTELTWRDVSILRMAAKFLRQTGLTFSQNYMEAALVRNSEIALQLIDLFYAAHDPDAFSDSKARTRDAASIRERIDAALENVPNADEDRIIRAFLAVVDASLRTNFFQRSEDGAFRSSLAIKLDSARLDMLPAPVPHVEIFVYSPEVEGVHLRFGPVARGGIRWSDRAEDFRTEVLGLVKAQQVKNAVIVPVGAKGGFYPKQLPKEATREDIQGAAIAAYKTFISALLDLTDNISADGTIIPPANVVRHDGDDPYLVVAADKGTASFSDIANALALEREFWLGDAFASGGSKGYDHKKMGITARGAWEAVKRHFRERGQDIQTEPFTCIGVGDMSGDVFGNAMLLSEKTKLVAAFDHRHIFFDPAPDPERSWAERKRLFDLPRSSWKDYAKELISEGGGVIPRSAKEFRLTAQMKALTGLTKDEATPQEIIRALLTTSTDLLFFGGIGTFVKSTAESHADVGDRANDSLRVDGKDVQAHVIGEGANLGMTQLGRVEYAREGGEAHEGGRVNTDAIDNSAGVDTSDHEVNLKILMNAPLRRGEISWDERDQLLFAMTDKVANLVLQDNYDQTLAISVAQSTAREDLEASARFVRDLERTGRLQRAVEKLPRDEAFREIAKAGGGLTRPEIALLLAYAKLDLLHDVSASALPEDPYFETLLQDYFPPRAVAKFGEELGRHRLKRDIVATQLVNRTVNLAGPLFAFRMRELSNAEPWRAARAFAIADGAFGLSSLKDRIDTLDLKVAAETQYAMMADIGEFLRRVGHWFIAHLPSDAALGPTIDAHSEGTAVLKSLFPSGVTALEAETATARLEALRAAKVPDDIARDVALLPVIAAVPEIVLLAGQCSLPFTAAAGAFIAVGESARLDRLRAQIANVVTSDHWDRLALRRIFDDLNSAQRFLAGEALSAAGPIATEEDGAKAAQAWAVKRADALAQAQAFLDEFEQGEAPSIGKLTLANSEIQKLANESA